MSKIKKIALSVLLIANISFSANASDISALNFSGDFLGKVIPDGSVINSENEIIGHITADGYVIDEENNLIGGIVPQGIAISSSNKVLGKVNNDGSVTKGTDSVIGKVLPNGLVVNDNYDVLGGVVSQGLVYNDSGKITGRVSGDGRFYDLVSNKQGMVTSTGYVYMPMGEDNKLELSGKLMLSKIVVSFSGKFLGSVAPDGKVFDLNKNILGFIHANGYVYDANNKAIGHIVKSGYAFDFNGRYLGVISYNGEVVDKGVVTSYAVNEDRVVDKSGNVIGFQVSLNATANALDGSFLGYIIPKGNIAKGREIVGKINASRDVVDAKGVKIGYINGEGPIFDYLGRIRANASVGGIVTSLEGLEQGFMRKKQAFDYKGREIGSLLSGRLVFDKSNQYIGISGVNSIIEQNTETYTISPYGYVFNKDGEVVGNNILFSGIYSPEGTMLSYTSAEGNSESSSLNEISKLDANGILIDKNNKILGGVVSANYATDFMGKSLGYLNATNWIIDNENKRKSKILPNNAIADINGNVIYNNLAGNDRLSISINGDIIGYNTDKGTVEQGKQIIGNITSSKYVVDNMGSLYGKVLPYATAVNKDCKFLGVVSGNGEIRNYKNSYIGTVLSNGQVINDAEEIIGHVITPGVIIGANGDVVGTENILGQVLNYQNQNLGCQDINGFIRNKGKEIIAQKVTYNSVMSFDDKIIGYTDISGKILDNSGVQISSLDLDGNIFSKEGESLGLVFKYAVAFDENNTYLGRIDFYGNVFSDKGEIKAKTDNNGVVHTISGKKGYALYDLYVYDADGNTKGYIAKNGKVYSIMGDIIGAMYNGFVIDKKQNLIARASRDYNIRDDNNISIGYLTFDGRVINTKNVNIAKLEKDGNIVNDKNEVIAKAHYLQYYQGPSYPKSKSDKKTKEEKESSKRKKNTSNTDSQDTSEGYNTDDQSNEFDDKTLLQGKKKKYGSYEEDNSSEDRNNDSEYEDTETDLDEDTESLETSDGSKNKSQISNKEKEEVAKTRLNHKAIGIAITPGGKYFGDVYDNNTVIGNDGEIVGYLDEENNVVDEDGNVVGSFDRRSNDRMKRPSNRNWVEMQVRNATISPYASKDDITNVGPGGGVGPGGRYNPRRAEILAQMHQERRMSMTNAQVQSGYNAESYTGWQDDWGVNRQISTLRVDMSNVITADKPIPAVLARSLVSLGSAPITAIVERNIYGDAGRNVIIPAGSRIIGGLQTIGDHSRFDASTGGAKIEINWNRIIRPDGIAFMISSAQTGDAQGRGGGALGYVDEQLVKKYTLPIVGTMVTSAITYMMAADDDATYKGENSVESSKQQAASDARDQFMTKMDEILQEIIDSKKEIEPVTYVPAGTRVIIYPMTDLWLRTTKDIEKGVMSYNPVGTENVLVTSDGNPSNATTTTTVGNTQQKVIMGNQNNNNQH
ncbi:MAG: hypothetical protein IKW39_03675 [Alphaproteobacteria bacterium]|nr:hypothetical protein [Alphaproteobacteria bacterium]